jgi:hypothetical protein
MVDDGRENVEDAVSEEETEEAEEVAVDAPKAEPRLVSKEELQERARAAVSNEGRLKHAKPFPLPTLECEVMVARTKGVAMYEKLFGGADNLFKGGSRAEIDEAQIDRAFIKEFILSCVVQPELDGETLDLILEANMAEFSALAAFCMAMTMQDPMEEIGARLGALDTEAQERFFVVSGGSMNVPTPV